MRRETIRRRLVADDGLTLVEIMVALLVLGVILSALAAVIMGSLRAIATSEREVRATALAQQSIEELQAIDWDAAGLYSDEVAAAPTDWNGSNTTTYDGDELIVLPAPGAGERLAQVPLPRKEVELGNVDYTVDRYITWIDGDGDTTVETKRFTALVTWLSVSGQPRSITSVGERVPTQAESPATSLGTRVLSVTAAPDPADLSYETAKSVEDIVVTIRLNQGIPSAPTPTLRFYTLTDEPADAPENEIYVERTIPGIDAGTMLGSQVGDNGFPTLWRATIPANTYRFANGSLDVLFTATDIDGNLIEAFGSVRLRGGPIDGPAPRPLKQSESGSVFPTPPSAADPEEPTGPEKVEVQAVLVTNSPICVNKSTWKLTKSIELTINTKGLVATDGTVTVTYINWTKKDSGFTVVTDTATFSSGNLSSSSYRLSIAKNAERLFKPGATIVFTVEGIRDDEENDTLDSSAITVSDAC